MILTRIQAEEFHARLTEACDFRGDNIKDITTVCSGESDRPISHAILKDMGISPEKTEEFLYEMELSGGHCDCEILLNMGVEEYLRQYDN